MRAAFILLSTITLFFLVSCHKSKSEIDDVVNTLSKKWQLRRLHQSWWPDSSFNANEQSIVFSGLSYQFWVKDSLVQSGTYTLAKGNQPFSTCSLIQYPYTISFDSIPAKTFFLRVSADSLILGKGCFANDSGCEKFYVSAK